jgi:archaellum component FlaC
MQYERAKWSIFAFILTFILLLLLVTESKAHYDHDESRERHYYAKLNQSQFGTHNTPMEFAQAHADYNNTFVCDPPTVREDGNWQYGYYFNSGCASSYTVVFTEHHCAHGQKHVLDGGCQPADNVCSTNMGSTIQFISYQDPGFGFNVPDCQDGDCEEMNPIWEQYIGCSFEVSSKTPLAVGYNTVATVTGSLEIDEDGLPYAQDNGNEYDDCIPWQYNTETQVIDDWGQEDGCEDNSTPPKPDKPTEDSPDNEGSDDTNPDNNPNEDATNTNTGNEGIEERLDILTDEIEEQGDTLNRIDSELDELDSNTEWIEYNTDRTADAAESMDEKTDNTESVDDIAVDEYDEETSALDQVHSDVGSDGSELENNTYFDTNPFSGMGGVCTPITISFWGHVLTFPNASQCADLQDAKDILEWFVYISIMIYGYKVATRGTA